VAHVNWGGWEREDQDRIRTPEAPSNPGNTVTMEQLDGKLQKKTLVLKLKIFYGKTTDVLDSEEDTAKAINGIKHPIRDHHRRHIVKRHCNKVADLRFPAGKVPVAGIN
jgi:hypothetical protein